MTKYKCGHEVDITIMNSNLVVLSAWLYWKDTFGFEGDKSMCWDCYCMQLEQKEAKEDETK